MAAHLSDGRAAAPQRPDRQVRLQRDALVPLADLVPIEGRRDAWLATSADPQFHVEGAARLAGQWVSLTITIAFDEEPAQPMMVYQDNGAGASEAAALRLYPDASGRVRYLWRTEATLVGMRFDPLSQPGAFTLGGFCLESLPHAAALLRAGLELSRQAAQRAIQRALALREAGWSALPGMLVDRFNRSAIQGQADRVQGQGARLQVLEGHLLETARRAAAETHWQTRFVPRAGHGVDPDHLPVLLVADYLQRFPLEPESDTASGADSDWRVVAGALPQFAGHHQPRLPAELGYYDQRLAQTLTAQSSLARHYGIGGFCFVVHGGGRPGYALQCLLADSTVRMRFCVRLAESPDARVADVLEKAFADPRHIRIDGKPLLLIDCTAPPADTAALAGAWREQASRIGHPALFLVARCCHAPGQSRPTGFDAVLHDEACEAAGGLAGAAKPACEALINPDFRGRIRAYRLFTPGPGPETGGAPAGFRSVLADWDDTPGRAVGLACTDATPDAYATWLRRAVQEAAQRADDRKLVFVNAWNDWANGTYLEPDRLYGHARLQATASVLAPLAALPGRLPSAAQLNPDFRRTADAAVIIHLHYDDLIEPLFERYFAPLAGLVDVFATVRADLAPQLLDAMRRRVPSICFLPVENRGRDILPFLLAYRQVRDLGYAVACKVHGKKSPHLPDGAARREYLFDTLIGSARIVAESAARLAADPALGLLYPARALTDLSAPPVHAGNVAWLDTLLGRLGMEEHVGRYAFDFPAGSMYWFRIEALAPLLDENIVSPDEFEIEAGQLDGTLAHGIERLIGLIASRQGFAAAGM